MFFYQERLIPTHFDIIPANLIWRLVGPRNGRALYTVPVRDLGIKPVLLV